MAQVTPGTVQPHAHDWRCIPLVQSNRGGGLFTPFRATDTLSGPQVIKTPSHIVAPGPPRSFPPTSQTSGSTGFEPDPNTGMEPCNLPMQPSADYPEARRQRGAEGNASGAESKTPPLAMRVRLSQSANAKGWFVCLLYAINHNRELHSRFFENIKQYFSPQSCWPQNKPHSAPCRDCPTHQAELRRSGKFAQIADNRP